MAPWAETIAGLLPPHRHRVANCLFFVHNPKNDISLVEKVENDPQSNRQAIV